MEQTFHATTIVAVRQKGKTAIAGDGQVTFGQSAIMKSTARKLEALLLVADAETLLMISGGGEVIEPDGDVAAIGSGGFYALAAARALVKHTDMEAAEIAKEALTLAADICVFTNHNIKVEELD